MKKTDPIQQTIEAALKEAELHAAAQAALDYAEELAATGLSSEQYDHYYL